MVELIRDQINATAARCLIECVEIAGAVLSCRDREQQADFCVILLVSQGQTDHACIKKVAH